MRPNKVHLAEGLEVIERSTKAQVQLINDVLDVSRIVSGKLRLETGNCDLVQSISAGTGTDLEELDITHHKAVELIRLTKTFLASDGYVDRMSNMREAFENDNVYGQIFNEKRLQADARKILLCYKVQFRVNRLVQAIMERRLVHPGTSMVT